MATCGLDGCSRRRFERDGIVHGYCGRTHANEAVAKGKQSALKPPHGRCHPCQLSGCEKTVYFDEGTQTVHDFCCRTHSKQAISAGQWPRPDSRGRSTCRLNGCNKFVYRDRVTGEESKYCSRSHVAQAKAELAAQCNNSPCSSPAWVDASTGANLAYCSSACASANGAVNLVGKWQCKVPDCAKKTLLNKHTGNDLGYCADTHLRKGANHSLVDQTFLAGTNEKTFKLSVLADKHPSHASLKEQFLSKWLKKADGLTVERILQVEVPNDVHQKHVEYEKKISNTSRSFHGTSCSSTCNFFLDLKGGPCAGPDCSICGICMHGFKLEGYVGRTAKATNFKLRYGEGLYFSDVSGKANDYAAPSEKIWDDKKWRCMFAASVAVGRAYKTKEGELPANMCPPGGYDAVAGEVGPKLNYDEVAVYSEDAALPTYLVVYTTA